MLIPREDLQNIKKVLINKLVSYPKIYFKLFHHLRFYQRSHTIWPMGLSKMLTDLVFELFCGTLQKFPSSNNFCIAFFNSSLPHSIFLYQVVVIITKIILSDHCSNYFLPIHDTLPFCYSVVLLFWVLIGSSCLVLNFQWASCVSWDYKASLLYPTCFDFLSQSLSKLLASIIYVPQPPQSWTTGSQHCAQPYTLLLISVMLIFYLNFINSYFILSFKYLLYSRLSWGCQEGLMVN